jgi:Asp-tRNA(Asn)/Glu-tRNA(Gln) amidotransferase B subunit
MGTEPPDEQGHFMVGAINVRRLADQYLMSHTHLQRLFRKAAEAGIAGWSGTRRKADLWVTEEFIANYQRWQAVKFSHIDRAFRHARARPG